MLDQSLKHSPSGGLSNLTNARTAAQGSALGFADLTVQLCNDMA